MEIDPHLIRWLVGAGAGGLVAGALSAAVIERWPRGRPLLRPWPWRRGGRRPRAWPAIAAAGAVASAGAVLAAGPGPRAVAAAALMVALVPVVLIDVRHRLIPDVVVLPAAAVALGAAVIADPGRWWEPAAAALGAAAFLLLPWLVRPAAMGLGDVKLALAMGAALGAAVVAALAAAFAAAAAAGAVLAARHGRAARGMAVPLGPFLAGGAVVGLAWGPAMIGWWAERLA